MTSTSTTVCKAELLPNTINVMHEFVFETTPVYMKVSGKGNLAWMNYTASELVERLGPEINRFGKVLRTISHFEVLFIFQTHLGGPALVLVLSPTFRTQCLPADSSVFGTGNETLMVSAAVVARVFLDDDLRLFDYDPGLLLSQTPEMFAFQKLQRMYETILSKIEVNFFSNLAIKTVNRKDSKIYVTDVSGHEEVFDCIVFTFDAETVLKVLKSLTLLECVALGNVSYFNDLIVTYEDEEYTRKPYEVHPDRDQYFDRTDDRSLEKNEMSFNLSNYQQQLNGSGGKVFQTTFLDANFRHLNLPGDPEGEGPAEKMVEAVIAYVAVFRLLRPFHALPARY